MAGQNRRYENASSRPNVGSKSRAAAQMRTSTRRKQAPRRSSGATSGAPPRAAANPTPSGGSMAGFNCHPTTLINMNGSGYDNPANQNALYSRRARAGRSIGSNASSYYRSGATISSATDYRRPSRPR